MAFRTARYYDYDVAHGEASLRAVTPPARAVVPLVLIGRLSLLMRKAWHELIPVISGPPFSANPLGGGSPGGRRTRRDGAGFAASRALGEARTWLPAAGILVSAGVAVALVELATTPLSGRRTRLLPVTAGEGCFEPEGAWRREPDRPRLLWWRWWASLTEPAARPTSGRAVSSRDVPPSPDQVLRA